MLRIRAVVLAGYSGQVTSPRRRLCGGSASWEILPRSRSPSRAGCSRIRKPERLARLKLGSALRRTLVSDTLPHLRCTGQHPYSRRCHQTSASAFHADYGTAPLNRCRNPAPAILRRASHATSRSTEYSIGKVLATCA